MKSLWEKVHTEDGREILFALYKTEGLTAAYGKTADIIRIIDEGGAADESQISLSSDHITIVLHGQSKGSVTQNDWDLAKQIEASLV